MSLVKRWTILITGIFILGFTSACQSAPTLAPSSSPGIGVGITRDTCPNVEVQVGQQVTWTNQDSREHIVRDKPAEGNGQFDSGVLQPGDTFAITFMQPGDYIYVCTENGSSIGTINVQP
jgi:hypothetical protein